MGKIELLDCTVRDGGYVNDWEFGHDNLVSIFERLVSAQVDLIEIGFLDQRRPFDINRSIMPNTESAGIIFKGLNKGNSTVVGMIDYGTCGIENLEPADKSFIDGIRVIFKKHLREPAIKFCKEVKKLGYKVFAQLVSITSYNDEELMDLVRLVNDLEPYAVSMVDTYGLLHKGNLMHYFNLLNKNLKKQIGLGYHSHNNFQLAYANCKELLEKKIERNVLVDGTVFGMGKGAGNAPIELLAMTLNEEYNGHYDINQILEACDVNIMNIYRKKPWGYSMKFYLAASNDCHPNYVTYLIDKYTLSVKSINEILTLIDDDKKLMYNQEHIEKLYLDYQNKIKDNDNILKDLKAVLENKEVLLLGPGKTVISEQERITNYMNTVKPTVISINYLPEFADEQYIFISNSKRYVQMATALSKNNKVKTISTSNVTKTNGQFDYTLEYSEFIDLDAPFVDNSLIMFLRILVRSGVKKVSLAGFDGYNESVLSNYYKPDMEYVFDAKSAKETNEYVVRKLKDFSYNYEINFITTSKYNK